jgi:type IV fimbrial biogenesis protein FimT
MRAKNRGLTLPELLITVAITALLAGISTPGIRDLYERQLGEKTLQTLAKTIQSGRSAAIRSGLTVTVCRSNDGRRCGGQWRDGIVVFTDRNQDRVINDADQLLQYVAFQNLPGTINWRAFQNRQYLQLNALGQILHQNGNFTYCPFSAAPHLAHQLIVGATGRMRFAQDTDGDGLREGSDGLPVSC